MYDEGSVRQMQAAGVTVHWVTMSRRAFRPANAVAVIGLRRLGRRLSPDVVHGHTSIGGALARLAFGLGGPPVVYTPHALVPPGLYRAVERVLGPSTTRLVAVSESEAEEIRALRLVRPGRVTAIPNGVDLTPLEPEIDLRAMLGLPAEAELVGTAVRLVPQKAPVEFVEACARVAELRPQARFVLIGAGPLQDQVDRAVARYGLADRWHQLAHLDRAAAAFGALDVFVLASRFEGGPYTPLEAIRAGTPVVLTDVVGNRDVVEPGISGLLVAFGQPESMAASVVRLLEDRTLRDGLVAEARRRLSERFGLAAMGHAYRDLYAEVAASRRRTRRLPQPIDSSSPNEPDARASQ